MLVVARTSVRASNSSPGLVNSSNNSTYVLVCHTVLRQQSNNTPTQGTPWGLPPPSSPPSSSCWRLCPVRRPARPGRTWGTTPAAKFSLSPAVAWLKITLTFLPHVSRDNCPRMFLLLLHGPHTSLSYFLNCKIDVKPSIIVMANLAWPSGRRPWVLYPSCLV